jgi:GNAT superfamily N-acetyltransferase
VNEFARNTARGIGSLPQGMADIIIAHVETPAAIASCFAVMSQLRPHLDKESFVARVTEQQAHGYHLASLQADGQVRALAGYRFFQTLAWGRICYVDDLVTDAACRSRSFGRTLFEWLVFRARQEKCDQLHLDSGVQRFDAHRFYLARRMAISSHHFSLVLTEGRHG